ncbi:MAG: 16S rRNA (cytidine(1402)-2'-O)-methyltransferase [bacterium]
MRQPQSMRDTRDPRTTDGETADGESTAGESTDGDATSNARNHRATRGKAITSETTAAAHAGTLSIVATPIGNLGDITLRAIEVLRAADLILAEDTRRSGVLLRHLAIRARVLSLHQHNEAARLDDLLARLLGGARIALISDAGTPLVNDPGYLLVRRARDAGVAVTPVPGANAAIAALSASGLGVDRFCFEGFLPARAAARARALRALRDQPRTIVLYESSHRIAATLDAIVAAIGGARQVAVAREISKKFETFYCGAATQVRATIAADARHRKGEFVVVIAGARDDERESAAERERAAEIMTLLMAEIPLKSASRIAARILRKSSNDLYALGVELKAREEG